MKKISYLIVNKTANLKAVSKEIFKLNVIVGNKRVENLEQEYGALVQKVIKGHTQIQQNMMSFYNTSELGASYVDWTNTPSSQSLDAQGVLRDECALAWPISYHELPEQKFAESVAKISNLGLKDTVFTYKNVLLTLPVNLNGNTDVRISECLNL